MSSFAVKAYDAVESVIFSEYSMDSTPAETWTDEASYRALNLVDFVSSLAKIILTSAFIIPTISLFIMAPRHLYEGCTSSWSQRSIYPIVYECGQLLGYFPAYLTLVKFYIFQASYSALGVILPSIGTYGRNYKEAQLAHAKAEVGDNAYSYQPTIDLLAQSYHCGAMNYSKA